MFDWVTGFVESGGYLGIACLMLFENLFPPLPSEVIMPLAGFVASRGDLDFVLVLVAGTLGSVAGALFWYGAGAWIGRARVRHFAEHHGRLLTLSPREVDAAQAWFDRYGPFAVLFGRLVPQVRTVISLPAGVAAMPMPHFLLYSAIGSVAWNSLLTGAGYVLADQYNVVEAWLNPVSTGVMVVIVVWYVMRVLRFRPHA